MSFLACHMWSFGWALASGAAWGSFWAMAFQSPHCHLLDQRPCFPSPADVAADGTAEASHLSVYHNFMHMDSDRYGSLITYVEADTTNKLCYMGKIVKCYFCIFEFAHWFLSSYGYISFDTLLCAAVLIKDISWWFFEELLEWHSSAQQSCPP